MTISQTVLRYWGGGAAPAAPVVSPWSPPNTGMAKLRQAVIAMGVVSLLVPVLVTGLLAAALLSSSSSGALPPPRPGIDSQITRVYDVTGREIATLHRFETNVPVPPEDIPAILRQAVVAAEDRRFYSHKGVDSRGIMRAAWADLLGSGYKEGGSTITQQYVRITYTGDERTLGRKLREAVLAGRVEAELSKDEILYRYLSKAYFGGGAYGVGAASQLYFRKSVRDLTLSEAALLAGILPAPSRYDPRSNPSDAERQRQNVLTKMANQDLITPRQLAEASAQPVLLAGPGIVAGTRGTLVYPPRAEVSPYPWFADYVRAYLVERFGDETVYQKGLRVETSLDPGLQAKAEAAVANSLKGTQAPLDMSMVVLEPKTGLVRAMVGGRDFAQSQVNLALGGVCPDLGDEPPGDRPLCLSGGGSGRQPGSAFKPFTLAKAFEEGITVDKTYRGPSAYRFPNCSGEGCVVHNVESGSYGSLNLRQATAYSVNTVYAQLIQDVGVKETAELAHRVGLTMVDPKGLLPSGEPYGASLTLGAAEVSPLDMAAAYGVFAARGMQFPATPVLKVTDGDGKVLEDNKIRNGKRVLAGDVADRVTDVLKGVVANGTGKAADIGRPEGTAGKTGTSEGAGDAWFVGYTPSLVASVWMGYADSRRPLENINGVKQVFGGTIPALTWKDFMTVALEGTPPADFGPAPAPPPKVTPAPAQGQPPPSQPQVSAPPASLTPDPGFRARPQHRPADRRALPARAPISPPTSRPRTAPPAYSRRSPPHPPPSTIACSAG